LQNFEPEIVSAWQIICDISRKGKICIKPGKVKPPHRGEKTQYTKYYCKGLIEFGIK
jgi:hypothetical protein